MCKIHRICPEEDEEKSGVPRFVVHKWTEALHVWIMQLTQFYCQIHQGFFSSTSDIIDMETGKWKRISHHCIGERKISWQCFREKNDIPNAIYVTEVSEPRAKMWRNSPWWDFICKELMKNYTNCIIPLYDEESDNSSQEDEGESDVDMKDQEKEKEEKRDETDRRRSRRIEGKDPEPVKSIVDDLTYIDSMKSSMDNNNIIAHFPTYKRNHKHVSNDVFLLLLLTLVRGA